MNQSCEWMEETEGPGDGDLDSLAEAGKSNVEDSNRRAFL